MRGQRIRPLSIWLTVLVAATTTPLAHAERVEDRAGCVAATVDPSGSETCTFTASGAVVYAAGYTGSWEISLFSGPDGWRRFGGGSPGESPRPAGVIPAVRGEPVRIRIWAGSGMVLAANQMAAADRLPPVALPPTPPLPPLPEAPPVPD
ncbi:MAG TPA: hypothetical protein VM840_13675, partial [Actinomycetota bacterium]|nr:hypothetical protein [Actinomycetota bacterium]